MQRIKQFFGAIGAFFNTRAKQFFKSHPVAIASVIAWACSAASGALTIALLVWLWPVAILPWAGIAAPTFGQAVVSIMAISIASRALRDEQIINAMRIGPFKKSPEWALELAAILSPKDGPEARRLYAYWLHLYMGPIFDGIRTIFYLIAVAIIGALACVLL